MQYSEEKQIFSYPTTRNLTDNIQNLRSLEKMEPPQTPKLSEEERYRARFFGIKQDPVKSQASLKEQYLKYCKDAFDSIAEGNIDDPNIDSLTKYTISKCIAHNDINALLDFKLSRISNPVDDTTFCKLLNNKKTKYYNYSYDPSRIIDNIKKLNIKKEVIDQYIDSLQKTFDLEKKNNCCNCISITLYRKQSASTPIYDYLKSIRRSVKNVQKFLPGWIVRIYLDTSVYNYVNTTNDYIDDAYQIVQFLLEQPHVEVYTYLCSDILSEKTPLEKIRTTRFRALYDPEVNIAVIREADGVVTYQDCHNLKYFEKSPHIFYLSPWMGEGEFKASTILIVEPKAWHIKSYSIWLQTYKEKFDEDFYNWKKVAAYDLMAGLLAVKLKLKSGIYHRETSELNKLIDSIDDESERSIMTVGFDEILLLRIYKDVISFDTKYDEPNEYKIYPIKNYESIVQILNAVFIAYNRNMKIIKANSKLEDMGKEIVTQLKNNNIIACISEDTLYNIIDTLLIKLSSYSHTYEIGIYKSYIYTILYVLDALLINNIIVSDPICLDASINVYPTNIPIFSPDLLNQPYTYEREELCDPIYDNNDGKYICSMKGVNRTYQRKYDTRLRKFNLAY